MQTLSRKSDVIVEDCGDRMSDHRTGYVLNTSKCCTGIVWKIQIFFRTKFNHSIYEEATHRSNERYCGLDIFAIFKQSFPERVRTNLLQADQKNFKQSG